MKSISHFILTFIMSIGSMLFTKAQVPIVKFSTSSTTSTQGQSINLYDSSSNIPSSWKWEITPKTFYDPSYGIVAAYKISPTDTSQNIKVTFLCGGKFNVCLTASNSSGSGTKVCKNNFIDVAASVNMCDLTVSTSTHGYLYDNGGPTGNMINGTCELVLDPCADTTYLVIDKFDLYCGLQYLSLYDGDSKTGKLLVGKNGSKQDTSTSGYGPGFTGGTGNCFGGKAYKPIIGDTFIATSGKMYLRTYAYLANYYSAPGFEAHWWSKPLTRGLPKAKFSMPDTICTNHSLQFINKSIGTNLSYLWDLDGDISNGFESKLENPLQNFYSGGKIIITLLAQNCSGIDTFSDTLTVYNPNPPQAKFTVDNRTPFLGDTVQFFNNTQVCIDDGIWTTWNSKGDSGRFVKGTNKYSFNPYMLFKDTGCWTVKLLVVNLSGDDSLTSTCYIYVKKAYCVPTVTNSMTDIGISRVIFNTIDNASTQGIDAYQNFTYKAAARTSVEIGQDYKLSVFRNTPMYNNMTRSVWIDWNADGDFYDTLEFVGNESNAKTVKWDTMIHVPSNTPLGATALRIATNYGNLTNTVCGGNKNGEYEDYKLYITADKTPPIINLTQPDSFGIQVGLPFTEPGYKATDLVDGNITSKVVVTTSPKFNKQVTGTYFFNYDVTDKAGNKAITKTRIVVVEKDTTAPIIVLKGKPNDMVSVHFPYKDPGVDSAYDNQDGNITSKVTRSGNVDTAKLGTYTLTYQVYDSVGKVGEATRIVKVVDTISPIISLKGLSSVFQDQFTTYKDSGYVVSDNYDKVADIIIQQNSTVNTSKAGDYTFTYSATDKSGNTRESVKRIVMVRDLTPPVLKLFGNLSDSIEANTINKDTGFTVNDNVDGKNVKVVISGTYFSNFEPSYKATKLGVFYLTYTATDASGNSISITKTIKVKDTKAPVINLIGNPTTTFCRWDKFTDFGYIVSDNFNDYLFISVVMSNPISTTLDGTFNFKYIATDLSGNSSFSNTRTVIVKSIEDCGGNYLGLKELGIRNNELRIYPNPNNGIFNIQLPKEEREGVRITVTNLMGQVVANLKSEIQNPQSEILPVDLTNQPSGIYFINVETEKGIIVRKVTVER